MAASITSQAVMVGAKIEAKRLVLFPEIVVSLLPLRSNAKYTICVIYVFVVSDIVGLFYLNKTISSFQP